MSIQSIALQHALALRAVNGSFPAVNNTAPTDSRFVLADAVVAVAARWYFPHILQLLLMHPGRH